MRTHAPGPAPAALHLQLQHAAAWLAARPSAARACTPVSLHPRPLPCTPHCAAGYTHERYREIIYSIRRYMPDASISGDAIVGFPGETEEQFQRTLALVEELGFDRVNTGAPACARLGRAARGQGPAPAGGRGGAQPGACAAAHAWALRLTSRQPPVALCVQPRTRRARARRPPSGSTRWPT